MCYMSLCCRSFNSNVTTIIESCMGRSTGIPDIETFAALGLHHLEEVTILYNIFLFFLRYNNYLRLNRPFMTRAIHSLKAIGFGFYRFCLCFQLELQNASILKVHRNPDTIFQYPKLIENIY